MQTLLGIEWQQVSWVSNVIFELKDQFAQPKFGLNGITYLNVIRISRFPVYWFELYIDGEWIRLLLCIAQLLSLYLACMHALLSNVKEEIRTHYTWYWWSKHNVCIFQSRAPELHIWFEIFNNFNVFKQFEKHTWKTSYF